MHRLRVNEVYLCVCVFWGGGVRDGDFLCLPLMHVLLEHSVLVASYQEYGG